VIVIDGGCIVCTRRDLLAARRSIDSKRRRRLRWKQKQKKNNHNNNKSFSFFSWLQWWLIIAKMASKTTGAEIDNQNFRVLNISIADQGVVRIRLAADIEQNVLAECSNVFPSSATTMRLLDYIFRSSTADLLKHASRQLKVTPFPSADHAALWLVYEEVHKTKDATMETIQDLLSQPLYDVFNLKPPAQLQTRDQYLYILALLLLYFFRGTLFGQYSRGTPEDAINITYAAIDAIQRNAVLSNGEDVPDGTCLRPMERIEEVHKFMATISMKIDLIHSLLVDASLASFANRFM